MASSAPMNASTRRVPIALASAASGAVLATALATLLVGQTPATYRAPRLADGKPDLNGIWQALNEANYDIESHIARPALAVRPGPYGPVPAAPVLALGAVGAVPPGLGVVEGGSIPYLPDASKKKQRIRSSGSSAIRKSSATCRAFLAPRTCRIPFRFSRARARSSLRTNMPAPRATFT